MRYPSPVDDPRRDACPLCDSAVIALEHFAEPPPHVPQPLAQGGSLVAVLDNIRSALNVGTMMRSADGVALDHLYLGGLTAPVDNPKVLKTALGAEQAVPISSALDGYECVRDLQAHGYELWAIDFTKSSVPLHSCTARPAKLAFIVGNERAGVDPALLSLADRHVHLDMHGTKSTLNVGVAFGVVAYMLRALPISG